MKQPTSTVNVKAATSVSPTDGTWHITPGCWEAVGPATVTVWVGPNEVEFEVPEGVPIKVTHGVPGTTATVTIG